MSIFRLSLRESLTKHKLWLESNGESGQRFSEAGANFEGIDFSGANLSKANLSGANLSGANLSETNLSEATLFGIKLVDANLNGANLTGASLSGSDLQRAKFQSAVLTETLLCEANLSGADLSNADLHKANLSLGIPEFIKARNIQSYVSGGAIPFVIVRQTKLKEANLKGAILKDANLDFANFVAADLSEADLSKAKLFAANLSKANLYGANLCGADLFLVKALATNFSFADLTDACIESWVIDATTNFTEVKCASIYLKHVLKSLPDFILRKYSDRRPLDSQKSFEQGDFVKVIIKSEASTELQEKGSDILQQQILVEELRLIFEHLSDQYSQRYENASQEDLQTLLKLEIKYQTKNDLAFKSRLLEAINNNHQSFSQVLAENNFVNISKEHIQQWFDRPE